MALSLEEREAVQKGRAITARENKARRLAAKARQTPEKRNRGRDRDNGYLAFLRRQPCVTCQAPAPNDAAHLRMASPERGKTSTGMQVKPSDRFAAPLCRTCHATQHSGSEARFWSERGLDPFEIADRLYAEYLGTDMAPRSQEGKA